MSNASLIDIQGVEKRFGAHEVLAGITLSMQEGHITAILGATGCGKSTLLNLVMGLDLPTAGTIRVNGRDPHTNFRSFRGEMAAIFQDALLLPWRSVLENVCIGMEFAGIPKAERRDRAVRWLDRLGLQSKYEAYPFMLSGGQRQRVSIARAFAVDPGLVLADEAFSALDEVTANRLRREFVNLVKEHNKTAIVVTHSIAGALMIADRIIVLGVPGHVRADFTLTEDQQTREIYREKILMALNKGH